MRPTLLVTLLLAGPAVAGEGEIFATFQTSKGPIVMRLLTAEAPRTVQNFVELAEGKKEWTDPRNGAPVKKPLFDGTLFHRVSPRFLIQGGDPFTQGEPLGHSATADGDGFGTGGPGYALKDEIPAEKRLFDKPCVLAMAKRDGETNGSQFFITDANDGQILQLEPRRCESGLCGYTRFGEGLCGCERVREIARAGNSNTRLEKVVISTRAPSCEALSQGGSEKQPLALHR